MLTRVRIRGYKSLKDVEVRLRPLTVLIGPNSSGKSNFLDALQLMSKMATSKTLEEAFDPPYRGTQLESFNMGEDGIRGLLGKDALRFSLEADFRLSDAVVQAVDQQIRDMRHPSGGGPKVRERNLRYRIAVEMLPRTGVLRVADEYLAALNNRGEVHSSRKAFVEKVKGKVRLRLEGQAHPIYFDSNLNHSILSLRHHLPHYPHVVAARRELESWLFYYLEPRERMRFANPVKQARHMGPMGEDLAAYLNTLRAQHPKQFKAVENALRLMIPAIESIEVDVNDLGEVELRLKEGGVTMSARVLSEGTLRLLGLLALAGAKEAPSLVGFEEPENGVHPSRLRLIAELLNTRRKENLAQRIITTHSNILPDLLSEEDLFVTSKNGRQTEISPLPHWGPLFRRANIDQALADPPPSRRPVSERVLRGDFDA